MRKKIALAVAAAALIVPLTAAPALAVPSAVAAVRATPPVNTGGTVDSLLNTVNYLLTLLLAPGH